MNQPVTSRGYRYEIETKFDPETRAHWAQLRIPIVHFEFQLPVYISWLPNQAIVPCSTRVAGWDKLKTRKGGDWVGNLGWVTVCMAAFFKFYCRIQSTPGIEHPAGAILAISVTRIGMEFQLS